MGGLEGEGEGGDEDVAVGGDDGDVNEFDGGGFDGGAARREDGVVGVGGDAGRGGGDKFFLEFAGLDVVDYGEEGCDSRGVAC